LLDFEIIHRKGHQQSGVTAVESFSSDFTINGESLLKMLTNSPVNLPDYLGCFARGWDKLNKHSLDQLLLKALPETESGRSLIYVCPECADIGCGAYGCKVKQNGGKYVWSDFAYENGYEKPEPVDQVGPFEFDARLYESIILSAYAL